MLRSAEKVFCGLFQQVFPDDCRVCGEPLKTISRVPVCSRCLTEPEPLVAEYSCSACRTPFVSPFPLDESGRCGLCRLGLTGYDAVYTYGSYEGALRKLIHVFKYERVHTLARPLGALLARVLPRELRFDAIVPMPLHWRRRWERGFNQSELLAKEISRRWGVPIVKAVRRVKPTAAQAGLTNAKRRANVSGAFSTRRSSSGVFAFRGWLHRKPQLAGARILLIDDVLTTGATAAACARALKRAGASHVTVLAVARTDRRMAVETYTDSSSQIALHLETRDSDSAGATPTMLNPGKSAKAAGGNGQ